ncbi:DUF397 domain-containing protein [Haloechinothrix sp. LS1_15]|uniref:DUF397 domain-containing protein n=1 Tax=Haloechinothrix sp. LS1_15 TaxID=2652248 RepID=UPI0029451DD0|nr:DUF397 domain-containing protein [Haloechinothrix sp. LS1_15]MDV6012557.1 DUF397 domain-containing protein [Haloechinothrix sp. LS1_15]
MTSSTRWRKSSYSGGDNNACVELDRRTVTTAIRDSKDPDGGQLVIPASSWHLFTTRLRRS